MLEFHFRCVILKESYVFESTFRPFNTFHYFIRVWKRNEQFTTVPIERMVHFNILRKIKKCVFILFGFKNVSVSSSQSDHHEWHNAFILQVDDRKSNLLFYIYQDQVYTDINTIFLRNPPIICSVLLSEFPIKSMIISCILCGNGIYFFSLTVKRR